MASFIFCFPSLLFALMTKESTENAYRSTLRWLPHWQQIWQNSAPSTDHDHKSPISALATRHGVIFAKPLIFNTKSQKCQMRHGVLADFASQLSLMAARSR
ncbi:hypothetical protein [Erwinia persicina]|uniref:hypothetical protein n=1 Tax=Erwinia persicina TaxID=55211 RepID=UPI00177E688C|nr:hypothetical protein [Erwinia persicina]MBD8161496.1 hypothetical protein [Erwinia persicina]MBD8213063.1 hypothetical protein [Erwinia persicina]